MGNTMPPLPKQPFDTSHLKPESVTKGCLCSLGIIAFIIGISIGFIAFLFANGKWLSNKLDQWFYWLVELMRFQ
jgi:hypothetical protein